MDDPIHLRRKLFTAGQTPTEVQNRCTVTPRKGLVSFKKKASLRLLCQNHDPDKVLCKRWLIGVDKHS